MLSVCRKSTRVGYNEVSSLVVEGSVSGTGRVPCSGQALVAKVHGVAVIQQRLSYLGIKDNSLNVRIKGKHMLFQYWE